MIEFILIVNDEGVSRYFLVMSTLPRSLDSFQIFPQNDRNLRGPNKYENQIRSRLFTF